MTDTLYHEALVGLARAAHGGGRLESADASARVDNPLCGDEVTVDLEVDAGRVTALGHRVRGCVLCEASASWMSQHAQGADAATVDAVLQALHGMLEQGEGDDAPWPGMEVFAPVHRARSRWRCVLLPLEALREALRDTGA